MNVQTRQLGEVTKTMENEELLSFLSDFKCSRNKDSEYFLKKLAPRHEKKDISRTYLLVDTDEPKIMGYFTLALKCLNLDKADLKPDIVELMNLNEGVAQAYMLGQLARADGAEKGSGKIMLDSALKTVIKGKNMFGCRMVRLDCKDELIGYYTEQGFQHIRKNIDKDLNQMVRFI